MSKIVIVDCGTGNLRSVAKALEFVASPENQIIVSDQSDALFAADRVVFPGHGAMGQCMLNLRKKALDIALYECLKTKPFLGICLGLALLMEYSDENEGTEGLGIIKGKVSRFPSGATDEQDNVYKVPHIGWNRVQQFDHHPLWEGISNDGYFYFAHSYYAELDNATNISASTDHAVKFASAISYQNIFATQFHPEKSQKTGLTLLKNFLNWEVAG